MIPQDNCSWALVKPEDGGLDKNVFSSECTLVVLSWSDELASNWANAFWDDPPIGFGAKEGLDSNKAISSWSAKAIFATKLGDFLLLELFFSSFCCEDVLAFPRDMASWVDISRAHEAAGAVAAPKDAAGTRLQLIAVDSIPLNLNEWFFSNGPLFQLSTPPTICSSMTKFLTFSPCKNSGSIFAKKSQEDTPW